MADESPSDGPPPDADPIPPSKAAEKSTATAPGEGIVRASRWGTAVFVVMSLVAAVAPDTFGTPALVLDVALFVAGCVLFGLAFVRAAGRSRTDAIGIGGLFFLAGDVAPPGIRRRLVGALVVQAVVGLATAGVRPYTNLAAGTLVPVFGLGLCGLWAARHGRFGPRPRRAIRS